MAILIVFLTLLVTVYSIEITPTDQYDCPEDCYCHFMTSTSNLIVDCSERNLTFMVYERLYKDTFHLSMNGNFLREIEPSPVESKVQILTLTRNFITRIHKTTFTNFHSLLIIDLSFNIIHHIHPEAFIKMNQLNTITLNGNDLEPVEGPFLYSESLRVLSLKNCHLTKLSFNFFANISYLFELDLSGNPLHTIEPKVFHSLIPLKRLFLNNCNLTYISNTAFDRLDHLNSLDLSENSFENKVNWTKVFSKLWSLSHLNLRHSGLSNLPERVFSNNSLLASLILAENNLSDFYVATTLGDHLINLKTLDISNCHLKGHLTEKAFTKATKLQTLILSENNICSEDLALALSHLSNIKKLSISNCGLKMLPVNTLHKFTSLLELSISKNSLHNVFTELILSSLETLEHLDMGYINLQKVSSSFVLKMGSLKTLILSGNKLEIVEPGLFQNVPRLKILELNNCKLRYLNGTVFHDNYTYPALEELKLSGNPLEISKTGSILSFQMLSLKSLDLSRCNLSYLPESTLISTPNISRLFLNENKFTIYNESSLKFISLLSNLTHLDLSFNNLTFITPDIFTNNHLIRSVKLNGNPWICSCYILDMLSWVASSKGIITIYHDDSTMSKASYNNNIRTKGLLCDFVENSTIIRKSDLWGYKRVVSSGAQNSWTWFLREAICPRKM